MSTGINLGFKGDTKALWHAVDTDGSGECSIYEFDPSTAISLAKLTVWAKRKFGGMPQAFKCIDDKRHHRVTREEFYTRCKEEGMKGHLWPAVRALDPGTGTIKVEDLGFLQNWIVPSWMVADPDHAAVQKMRTLLAEQYGGSIRGWRRAMDVDQSNGLCWDEFSLFCRKHELANAAGMWRALDEDHSGSITLCEVDERAADILCAFKLWLISSFGGVMEGFMAMDEHKKGEVSYVTYVFFFSK